MPQQHEVHVYDNTLKALFGDEAAEIIPAFLPGTILVGEQNIEIDRSKLKADLVYTIVRHGKPHLLNIELQTDRGKQMPLRLLTYHVGLLDKFDLPVISLVMYPFQTSLPKSPYLECSGQEVLLSFSYRVVALWKRDARTYVRKGVVAMYTFLPAMQQVSVPLLHQALGQMQQRYPDRKVFEQHLLRFVKVLERSTTMMEHEKKEVKEVLHTQYAYDYFIDENPDVKERVAKGEQKGRLEGEQKGQIEALRQMVLDAVQESFPALMVFAQERVVRLSQPDALRKLAIQVLKAPDEAAVRKLFQVVEQ